MTIQNATFEMLGAVNGIVEKARGMYEGIPETVVVLGASGATRQGQKHGHFAPRSWKARGGGDKDLYGELFLSGESLERGAVATLGTILHELVHAYNHAHDVQDCSNNNRYHNAKFKAKAEEFGLEIDKAETIGWSVTTVPEGTVEKFRAEVDRLEAAIKTHRLGSADLSALGLEPEKKKPKKRFMQCPECQEPVLVTKRFWEKQGNGGGDYEHGVGIYCGGHNGDLVEYEIYEEGGED